MKNVQISRQYLLSYKTIYDEQEFDLLECLKVLPVQPSLEVISLALHSHNRRKRSDRHFQSTQLFSWMMQMESGEQNKIVEFAERENALIGDPSFRFLDRRACLHLLQHILVYSKGQNRKLERKDHSSLFKCMLLFNSITASDQESIFNWDGTGTAQQFADHILPFHFKNIDLTTYRDYRVQFLKVYYFFKFCELDEIYSSYLSNFLAALKIKTYQSYLWRVLDQMFLLILNEETSTKVQISGDENYMGFYDSLSINSHIQSVHPDLLTLRQFPLFKLSDNQFIYLDYRLFVDKFYQSFLFDFASQAKISVGTLKSHMGKHFSETVLFYKVMSNCFSKYGNIRLDGNQLKALLKESEPDYYLREGAKVFMFEFKDLIVSSEVKCSGDLIRIKNSIIEKLEKTTSGQNKGISQITNNIIKFNNGDYRTKNVDQIDPLKAMIYPILVHTDVTLESYGVNRFMNERFDELLKNTTLPVHQIKKVILINIDTLLELQDYFADGSLKLGTCINAYIDYVNRSSAISANFPFDEYVKQYLGKKIKKRPAPPQEFIAIVSEFEKNAKANQ